MLLAAEGLTNVQIANALGINSHTARKWRRGHQSRIVDRIGELRRVARIVAAVADDERYTRGRPPRARPEHGSKRERTHDRAHVVTNPATHDLVPPQTAPGTRGTQSAT